MNGASNAYGVLILYPWGIDSVINRNIGAGVRVGLLAEFLCEQGYTVTVASIGLRSRELRHRGVRFIEYRYPSNILLLSLYGFALTLVKMTNAHALRALLYFQFHRIDRSFRRRVRDLASSHAQVLLEYPFWHAMLDVPNVILTNHDAISESWAGKSTNPIGLLLQRLVLRHEVSAMQHFVRPVVVSKIDRDFFRSRGICDPVVIENPVRLPEPAADVRGVPADGPAAARSSAIFIGGGWHPNVHAAQVIAEDIAPRCPQINFILAGDCVRNVRRFPPNVTRLGRISASMLEACYRDATYAVIPLLEGTGSSLKTIEAMAYGKVVVSTRIGVRGIAFEDGVHGIVCDDLDRYPEVLRQLDQDPGRRAMLSRNAVELSRSYDYRVVFRKYLELMRGPRREPVSRAGGRGDVP